MVVEASGDGGTSYTVLATYDGNVPQPATDRLDLTSFLAADTRVRFRVSGSGYQNAMWVDNVEIEVEHPGVKDHFNAVAYNGDDGVDSWARPLGGDRPGGLGSGSRAHQDREQPAVRGRQLPAARRPQGEP